MGANIESHHESCYCWDSVECPTCKDEFMWHYLWRFYETHDYMSGTNHMMNCCNLPFELVIKSRNKLHGVKPKQIGGLVSNRLSFLLRF